MTESQMIAQLVPMVLIDRPEIPDREYIDQEELRELANSIAQRGLLQPVTLNRKGERYEVVYGDRRYLAHVMLGRQEILSFVKEMKPVDVSLHRAIENIQRRDLNVIEEARVYKRLHDDHNMTWDELAKQTGKSVALIRRRYHLLEMPEILVKAMQEGKIIYVVAEELNRLKDVGKIEYLLSFAVDHGATKDVVREWVKEEISRERQAANAGEGGYQGGSVFEEKPVYVPCDLCQEAMKIGSEVVFRICHECAATIKSHM
jgi:ParB/RepB/Spo0J family partition protein